MGVAPDGSGCVLVAEMSTAGTLATGEYSKCEMKIKLLVPFQLYYCHSCCENGRVTFGLCGGCGQQESTLFTPTHHTYDSRYICWSHDYHMLIDSPCICYRCASERRW